MIIQKSTAAAILAAILIKRRKTKKVQKRIWARQWIQRRDVENTVHTLLLELKNERVDEFSRYFRLSPEQFEMLLERVSPMIQKRDTNMRKAISPETRLAITLRYLSSGDSYRSLMLLFRVPHNTISGIVSETCQAIYSALVNDYVKVWMENFRTIQSKFNSFVLQVPNTGEEWLRIAQQYYDRWNFPNCIGILNSDFLRLSFL